MTKLVTKDESDEQDETSKEEETTQEEEEDEDEDDSGNEEEEDFLSEDLNLPETEDDFESDSANDYPVILDDSEEDRIFKRQLSYPPIPMYHPPRPGRQQVQSTRSRSHNPRDKIGMLTPMEEVTEPPSSAATSIDGERRSRSRGIRACSRNTNISSHNHLPSSNIICSPSLSAAEQKSILKSKENLQEGQSRRVTFEGPNSCNYSMRSGSPTESQASNTSEYSSMADSGRQTILNDIAKTEIQGSTIVEEAEETEGANLKGSPEKIGESQNKENESTSNTLPIDKNNSKHKDSPGEGKSTTKTNGNSGDLELISDIEQGEKVIQWQMENAKSESSDTTSTIDSEFASIVNGIIAELHNLDELIGSFMPYSGAMEMNASKQDHLANVSTQLATYVAQVSPQTILTNLPQVIPLVTSLLYLTGSNFRSQLASLTAVNVFIERLRDCKTHSGLRVLPQADLTWLVRALCELSSESSRSVLKNEGILALARLIKTTGPEMVFNPILFILTGNDEKVRKKRKEGDDEDRVVIPTGGPGGAPKLKAIALDSLTFALLTFPRDDFNLNIVAKLGCRCLLHPKRRMRQASLECLSVVSHSLGSHVALPMFRQMIMEEEQEEREREAAEQNVGESVSSDASASGGASASSDQEVEPPQPVKEPTPSRIPIPVSRLNETVANPNSPKKLKITGSPLAAVSARISRHLLPTPSLNDLVDYALKIPAITKLLSRQNRAVSRQDEIMSGGESGESGGSANMHGRRIASSSGTSSSSITNFELELEPVLNSIGSGRRKQTNDVANSVMAADVAWILAGSGPIKPCEATSVLAPIYKLPDKELISDKNLTHTHIRQMGMLSSGLESDSNSSEHGYSKTQRGDTKREKKPNSNNFDKNQNGFDPGTQEPNMGRGYYYQGNGSSSGGSRGMSMPGGSMPPSDNNNSGRMSSSGSYSLLPNKYSLGANTMGVGMRPGGNGNLQNGVGHGGNQDPMMSPHHIPGGGFDYSYGSLEGIDGYNSSALNSADPYDPSATSMRAPSRAKIGGPLQPVHSLRDPYYAPPRSIMKPGYSDEDPIHNESSASSEEEEDIHSQLAMKSDVMNKTERRASQTNNKSSSRNNKSKDSHKSGKSSKSSKHSPKKGQKDGNGMAGEPDKVEQIVSRLQQEYQVYRLELDQTGPSPEELAAAKKKRGELDSAGSNSRDSGVSIGAGSIASVHSPSVDQKQSQQGSPTAQEGENESTAMENHASSNNTNGNDNNNNGKKEGSDRTSKRKSSLKSVKKSSNSNSKAVHHAMDGDDGLSRNWKSTPDVASIMDEYEPRMPNYRRMSTEHGIAMHSNVADHDLINPSPYHSASNIGGAGDSFMTLHRKPVLAGRRQSLSRPQDELERQLALIPTQQQTGRSSRQDYHQHHSRHQHGMQNGYAGVAAAGLGHLHHEQEHFHRVSSMLDMDKAPSRESSAGSGNTYSLNQHDSLHPHSLSSHLRSSKSTGNLLGVDDIYGSIGGRSNTYYEMMDHPGSPGRRMLHSRMTNHHAMVDLGNSTDDMEFPMTPQSESSSNTLPKQSRGMMTGRMNPKIVPKKIYKGSFREVNARGKGGNMGAINAELFPLDLKPVTSPKHALPAALLQVQASDWETNVDGFRQLVRLARHHPEFIRSDLHNVNMNALRHVMNLRTQVCRAAILFFRELFMNLGKAMEHDSERIAEKLLDKAADTNKFIREDSGKALEALVLNVSPAKALTCLDLYGTRHRNPAVRCMTARMTTKLIEKLGVDRCLSEVPERLLPMLCRFLQEGSLDTRMSAKLAFSSLMESSSFDTQLKRHVPADTLRHVQKAMKAITTKS